MEVVDPGTRICYTGYTAKCQKGLASKVIRRQNIVVHNRKCDHCSGSAALLQRDAKFKTLVEYWMQCFFMDVRLLFVAVGKYSVRQQFNYDKRVTETIWVQRDYIPSMKNLKYTYISLLLVQCFLTRLTKGVGTKNPRY